MVSLRRPFPSFPRNSARRGDCFRASSVTGTESSESARAAVWMPYDRRDSAISAPGRPVMAQGTRKTVPMLTRRHLLDNGSQQPLESRMASIFSAAALRKMAPMFAGFPTSSSTANRRFAGSDATCPRAGNAPSSMKGKAPPSALRGKGCPE